MMKMGNKKQQIQRKYHLFDASQKRLGRLASEAAKILMGKDKPSYTPNIDGGDFVVVINSDNLLVTGGKMEKKMYYRYSGYPGGIYARSLAEQIKRDSTKTIEKAVYGMLPKNKLRNKMMKRLLIYKNEEHKHKIEVNHS